MAKVEPDASRHEIVVTGLRGEDSVKVVRLRIVRSIVVGLVLVAAGCSGGGSRASAPHGTTTTSGVATTSARIVTWTLTSRFVDPTKVRMAARPAGVASRPNALRVNVYLPQGYDGARRFPVLYLLNGAGAAYDDWAAPERGDLLNTVTGFQGIIVMPEASFNGWYTNWWNGGRRADPAWESFYLDELIPYVEQHLAVLPGRQYHAIAGFSMGGGGALFLAGQLPGYFGTAASFSGTLSIERPEWREAVQLTGDNPFLTIYGDPVAQEFYWAGHNPKKLVRGLTNTRVYVASGNGVALTLADRNNPLATLGEAEILAIARDFVSAAQAAHVPVTFRIHGGIHVWPYWRQDLADVIRWNLFAAVPQTPSTWTYLTVAQRGDIYGYKFAFQQPPTTLETFTYKNGSLVGTGSGQVQLTLPTGSTLALTMPFKR